MITEITDISLSLQGQIGAGSLNNIVAQCEQLGIKKPLIVTDPVMAKIGVVQRVADLFSAAGLPAAVYDRCVENPRVPDITGGAEEFKSEVCDGIIGLGGGTTVYRSGQAAGISGKFHGRSDCIRVQSR